MASREKWGLFSALFCFQEGATEFYLVTDTFENANNRCFLSGYFHFGKHHYSASRAVNKTKDKVTCFFYILQVFYCIFN